MLATERLDFSKEKIFNAFRDSLQKCDDKTKNLIDCKDDIVFAWDNKKKILLTQNLKILNQDPPVYQELFPTEPPLIDIQFIRVNSTVSKAVLWEANGAYVIDIPRRWGSQSSFQGGKETVLASCKPVEDRYYTVHKIEIRQIRFHPGSSQDNHILVLTSNNTFRLYMLPVEKNVNQTVDEPEFLRTWSLGQNPLNLSGRVPFLVSLGDTAVDFDFALPVLDEDNFQMAGDNDNDKIIWPVIVLRGNGDICILRTSLTSNAASKFEGPLPIYPPADDNYGVDACSVLVMPTLPNIVVVATSSGTIYHSILLNMPKDECCPLSCASQGLYVMESVELELGLHLNDEDPSFTCPVILHRDPQSRWKYFCTHSTGIHAVLMGFVPELEKFIEKTDVEIFSNFDEIPSTVEYLVCTKTNITPISPILGFTIVKSWNFILAVLSDGDVISLPLKMADILFNIEFSNENECGDEVTPLKKLLKEPFDLHIKSLLKRNVNQPILKLDKNAEMSAQDCLDLITRTTNILRQEYFSELELIRYEIEQRAATLAALKELQLQELKQLEMKRPELQEAAEKLAEKFEKVKEKHQYLMKGIEAVALAAKKLEPIESLAEKKMKNELESVEEKLENYDKSIRLLKDKIEYQRFKIWKYKREKKTVHLGSSQVETIKKNLIHCSGEIADLVNTIHTLKRLLHIT